MLPFFGIMLFSNFHAHLLLFSKVSSIIPKFFLIMLKFIQNENTNISSENIKMKLFHRLIIPQHDAALNVIL